MKFNPAAGLAAGSTHNCTITVTYGGVVKKTMTIVGTVAASASVSLNPASLTLRAAQGVQASGTITLQGVALSGDVTLALTGTGLSFEDDAVTTTKTVSRADAENGTAITIYYTAGASDVNGSLTATSGTATASATVSGHVVVPLAVGSYFDVPNTGGGGKLRYTVLDANSVSVQAVDTLTMWPSTLVIPATVNDAADGVEAVYDSGGNVISASGMSYNVTTIAKNGFKATNNWLQINDVTLSEGISTIESSAFDNRFVQNISVPSTVVTVGGNAFASIRAQSLALPDCECGSYMCIDSAIKVLTLNGTILKRQACHGATSIEKVYINGCDVAQWGDYTFHECSQFSNGTSFPEVHIDAVTPPALGSSATTFPKDSNGKIQATLYVPANSVSSYTNHVYWGQFNSIVAEPSNN